MRGLKVVIPFAACGFILSFVAGLFSHSSILSILLKALIFAILFGGLGLVIDLVFRKFLYEGSSDFQGDTSDGISQSSAPSSSVGQKVDITIQDEELAPSESENHFVVGENHQMLNDSDVKNVSNESPADSSQGFVPLRNFETVKNFSGKEAQSPFAQSGGESVAAENSAASASAVSTPAPSASSKEDSLDTLPDMEGFAFGGGDSESDDDDVSSSDSDSEFVSVSSGSKKQEEVEVKDAALMAKAISSVLSDENSM